MTKPMLNSMFPSLELDGQSNMTKYMTHATRSCALGVPRQLMTANVAKPCTKCVATTTQLLQTLQKVLVASQHAKFELLLLSTGCITVLPVESHSSLLPMSRNGLHGLRQMNRRIGTRLFGLTKQRLSLANTQDVNM
jgi:hypothetical protein